MSRSRRSVLATLAGGVAVLGGCSSTGGDDEATSSSATPTVAFSSAAPATGTDSGTATESPTGTETPDPVARALTAARADLETAVRRLEAAEVVEDGRVGIVSANAFAEYADAESPRPPIRAARQRLNRISDRAGDDRRAVVNGLLFLCEYLETRATQHDRIVDGFSSFYQATRVFPTELELKAARGAVGDMRALNRRVGVARDALDRIEVEAEVLGVPGFGVAPARERQRTFRRIAREFEPAVGGALSTMRTVGLLSATAPAIERGNYERAVGFAADAGVAAGNATKRLETAFERDVRHYRRTFERYRCLSTELGTVAERYVDAAEAYLNDRPGRGRERYRAAREALSATEAECGIEL